MGRAVAVVIVSALLAMSSAAVWPTARGMSLIVRAADLDGPLGFAAHIGTSDVDERQIQIVRRAGALRARLYSPTNSARRTIIVVPGLHAADLEEPRLVALARELAASGVAVVTPAIPELSRFEISPAIPDAIADTILWAAADRHLAPDGRIGVIGVSFSGGLALVAAGRPAVREKVAFVVSIGAHADLPRVLRYLCTGMLPRPVQTRFELPSKVPAPHDYGVAVLLLALIEKLVPPEQRDLLDEAVRDFLQASHVARSDQSAAMQQLARWRLIVETMPEPSASLVRSLLDRDVAALGARILPFLDDVGTDPALSPSRSPSPIAPVFLLHGLNDNVIPASESVHLADGMPAGAPVRLLISPLISHAEISSARSPVALVQLARFAGDVLRQ